MKPSYTLLTFSYLTFWQEQRFFRKWVGGGSMFLKRCYRLSLSLFLPFFVRSLFHCSLARILSSSVMIKTPAQATSKLAEYLHGHRPGTHPASRPTDHKKWIAKCEHSKNRTALALNWVTELTTSRASWVRVRKVRITPTIMIRITTSSISNNQIMINN